MSDQRLTSKLAIAATQSLGAFTFLARNKEQLAQEKNVDFVANRAVEIASLSAMFDDCFNTLTHNPTIGIYGASQAGKSYLVSTLSTGGSSSGNVTLEGRTLNFQKHLDAKGNNTETSSLVTRFVSKKYDVPEGYPVKMHLLNEVDLIKICISAFYNDLDITSLMHEIRDINDVLSKDLASYEAKVDKKAVERFKSLENANEREEKYLNAALDPVDLKLNQRSNAIEISDGQGNTEFCYFTPIDIINLADFVEKVSDGKIHGLNSAREFWLRLSWCLPFIPLKERQALISKFWCNYKAVSFLFNSVSKELASFKGATTAYLPLSVFVDIDSEGQIQSRATPIMAVQSVESMFNANVKDVQAAIVKSSTNAEDKTLNHLKDGFIDSDLVETVTLKEGILSALGKEVIFTIDNSSELLSKFDVLDFPGARSRNNKDLDTVNSELERQEFSALTGLFIRGKVDLLFGSYVDKKQMQKLIFCVNDGKQEVKEAYEPLQKWINNHIGQSPEDRQSFLKRNKGHVPLFICLTKFDKDIDNWVVSDSNRRIDDIKKNFKARIEYLLSTAWFTNWTNETSVFNNCFIVRNPTYGGVVWTADASLNDSSSASLNYATLNMERKAALDETIAAMKSKEAQLEDKFKDFDTRINALLETDGGVKYLVNSILAQETPFAELEAFCESKLEKSQLNTLYADLDAFAQRGASESRDKAFTECKKLALDFMQTSLKCNTFYMLREVLDFNIEFINLNSNGSNTAIGSFTNEVCTKYADMLKKLKLHCETLSEATSESAFEIDSKSNINVEIAALRRNMLLNKNDDSIDPYDLIIKRKRGSITTMCNMLGNSKFQVEDVEFLVGTAKIAYDASHSFFVDHKDQQLSPFEIKCKFAGLLAKVFKYLYDVFVDPHYNFKLALHNSLKPIMSDTARIDSVLLPLRRETKNMLSDFALKSGTFLLHNEAKFADFATVPYYYMFKEENGYIWPIIADSQYLKDKENDPFVFKTVKSDDMGMPILNDQTKNPDKRLICDFFSSLTHMMINKPCSDAQSSVLLKQEENEKLISYLDAWHLLTGAYDSKESA